MLLLDNHDSFTWNLVELLRSLGKVNVKIVTPEKLRISDLKQHDRIIFSPGPGLPEEQPAMFMILDHFVKHGPGKTGNGGIFGVCLGMQAIALYFGGSLYQQQIVMHGQPVSLNIKCAGHRLFRGIENGTPVGLYHSWAVEKGTFPNCLEILAESDQGVIMAIAHKTLPIQGVQFHPESIITLEGKRIMSNLLF